MSDHFHLPLCFLRLSGVKKSIHSSGVFASKKHCALTIQRILLPEMGDIVDFLSTMDFHLGLNRAKSHALSSIESCLLATPQETAALANAPSYFEREASPLFGWLPDGAGELNDSDVDYLLNRRIERNRHIWEKLPTTESCSPDE